MKTFILFLALLVTPFAASAGELSSDFRGQVVDSLGEPVPGAVMFVEHVQTGRITRHVANAKGRWHAVGRRSDGTYRVSCFAPGSSTPAVRFQGRVALGQVHVRNCVVGKLIKMSPKWLSSWQWKQPTYVGEVVLTHSTIVKYSQQRGPGTYSCSPATCPDRVIFPGPGSWAASDATMKTVEGLRIGGR